MPTSVSFSLLDVLWAAVGNLFFLFRPRTQHPHLHTCRCRRQPPRFMMHLLPAPPRLGPYPIGCANRVRKDHPDKCEHNFFRPLVHSREVVVAALYDGGEGLSLMEASWNPSQTVGSRNHCGEDPGTSPDFVSCLCLCLSGSLFQLHGKSQPGHLKTIPAPAPHSEPITPKPGHRHFLKHPGWF